MSENISFRSAMNGFNRNDVMKYINALLEENMNLQSELSVAKQQLSELSADEEEVSFTSEEEVIPDCADCPEKKLYEAKLGAAMLDARRFSDILVKEANDKAREVFNEAALIGGDTSEKANDIAKQISETSQVVSEALNGLFERMNSLVSKLNEFGTQAGDYCDRYEGSSENESIRSGVQNSTESVFDFGVDNPDESEAETYEVLTPKTETETVTEKTEKSEAAPVSGRTVVQPEPSEKIFKAGEKVAEQVSGFSPNFNFLRPSGSFSVKVDKDD